MKLFVRTANCPLCHAALKLKPADAEVVNVDTVDGLAEYYLCYNGGTTVPVLIVGEEKKTVFVGEDVIKHLKGEDCDDETV